MLHDRQSLERLIAEVRENAQRYCANIDELKWLLYYVGDEPAALLAEWDWHWPAGATLQPAAERCFLREGWRRAAGDRLSAQIDAFYALMRQQPPGMEAWSQQWSADGNHLYLFLFGKLDELRSRVTQLASAIVASAGLDVGNPA